MVALVFACTVALAEQKPLHDEAPPPGDPFAFRASGMEADGFVSVSSTALPPGIRIVAILMPRNGEAIGVLEIPGAKALHFVREGDVVQLESQPGARAAPRTATDSPGTATPTYLLIVSVSENQIEIAPRARPQDTRIYR